MKQSKVDTLIESYNLLDMYMREKLRVGGRMGHTDMLRQMAKRNEFFSRHETELFAFSKLRNLIVHNVYPLEAEPFAEPNEVAVTRYAQLVHQIVDPPRALSIAVKARDIYVTTLEHRVMDVMRIMTGKYFTHVPVLEGDNMIGVFSENTVFTYIAEKGAPITETTPMREFAEYLPIDKHKIEHFEFVGKDALITDVEALFRSSDLKGARRLAVVYITEKGKVGESLLGMITAWDLAGLRK